MNAKRRIFVEEYLTCWIASEAARRAGYRQPYSQGPRLLKNVEIAAAIQTRISEKAMTADEVLLRLADQARGSMADFVTEYGIIDLEHAKSLGRLHLVKKWTVTEDSRSIELYDAQAALVHIGRAHGLFKDKQEISGPDGAPITITVIPSDGTFT